MAASLIPGMEFRYIRRVSESQSETSSNTTEVSDNDIAIRLGLPDASALKSEKVKVDRKKLEEMIQNALAVTFFDSLMRDTTTQIFWPNHLKIDAKSKKDVHVKIMGKPENFVIAKERVLEKLDARGSRVTMKMDISYNDHSSIIGTRGATIKKIMDDTSTHIHFPDSNKESKESKESKDKDNKDSGRRMPFNHHQYSHIEGMHNNMNRSFPPKSNQVSLNGTLEGVEKARAAVRYTSPLSISFETPLSETQMPTSTSDSYIAKVIETYNVKVVAKTTRQKLHSTTINVKGTEKESINVKHATCILIHHYCETLANQTKVCLQMEISTQHHDSIKGPGGSNLRQIMEDTKTTIIFPDIRDGNTPQSKRTHVTIKGCIDGVYLAKQQLIGNLIVTLSFDYPETCKFDLDALNAKYGVIIACRDKKKDSKSIAIKGKEKFIDKIYEARHELLKLTTPLVKASIPPEYYSKADLNDEFAFRQTMAIESPMSHYQWARNFGANFEEIQNTLAANANTNMHNWQYRRQRMPQNHINNNFLSPHPNMSPRNSVSPITSGYNSHNSFNSSNSSLDAQLFQQSQNAFLDRNTLPDSSVLFDDEKTPTLLDVKNSFNFEQRKIEGYRAMKRALEGETVRTPTSAWSGLGLSQTSPFSLETVRKTNDWDHHTDTAAAVSPFGLGKTTGIVDSGTASAHFKDMQTLLVSLGLEHYINTFHVHEIDLDMFSTLTPENLTTLGIQAFGARKKLLLAIQELNAAKANLNRSTKFSGSAAPGAERRTSGDW